MKKLAALVAFLVLAGAALIYITQPVVVSVSNPKPVGTILGVVKSISLESNSGSPVRTAVVQLADGSQVEASVLGSCSISVGQTASLSVFQPTGPANKFFVV